MAIWDWFRGKKKKQEQPPQGRISGGWQTVVGGPYHGTTPPKTIPIQAQPLVGGTLPPTANRVSFEEYLLAGTPWIGQFSTNVERWRYDDEFGAMVVQYKHGRIYEYPGVTELLFTKFLSLRDSGGSPGRAIWIYFRKTGAYWPFNLLKDYDNVVRRNTKVDFHR